MGRLARLVLPTVATAGAAVVGTTGWLVADRMLRPPREILAELRPPPEDLVEVVSIGADVVVLAGPRAARAGRWGLEWEGGYGQVGEPQHVVEQDPDGQEAQRRLTVVRGDPPGTGATARLDPNAWPEEAASLGLPWEELHYHSPAGEMPAWVFPGPSRTWAIFVHGRAGRRSQTFRLLRVAHGLGMPSMAIAYRNDPDAPLSEDARCHLGEEEWQDVEGAVVAALARGAEDVVLVGYSMGGTAVLSFLRTSAHARRVRAVVLEAPVVRWRPVIRRAVANVGAPRSLAAAAAPVALAVAGVRAGIEWGLVDHVAAAGEFDRPMLVIHGEDDRDVPLSSVEPLALRRPDLVDLLRVPGGEHLTAWNVDPQTVESAVRTFLTDALAPPTTAGVTGRARRALGRLNRAGGRRPPPRT